MPGEKLHEQMIGVDDAAHTYEYPSYYKILPAIHDWSSDPERINGGRLVAPDFTYASNTNPEWMTIDALRCWIDQNRDKIGKI
jgi:FlaA1/EpsC-like NDP-sugar epimerase